MNMDVCDYDHSTETDLTKSVRNFILADYLQTTQFVQYDGMVLGEVLEHCTMEIGAQFLKKMRKETKTGGHLILTLPQDHRDKYEQYAREEEYLEYAPGITSWHQTVWTKELLDEYLSDAGWKEIEYNTAWWFKDRGIFWHLIVAEAV
jgi:cyclopropane fatty-acyl-phospholipid synthase-like methyltransferase